DHRPPSPELGAGRRRLRSSALPAADRAEDQFAGSGCTSPGLGSARRVRHAASPDGRPHGKAWPARVCAGAAPAGKLRTRRPARGGEAAPSTRRDRLRRRQASSPVSGGAPAAATGPVHLPIPAEGDGRDDIGEGVHASSVHECGRSGMSAEASEILLSHYLKTLKLPTFQREYQKLARLCATEGVDHVGYLTRLSEREMIERDRRKVERRIKAARFPVVKSLDSFDFAAIPKLNKMQVLELARCEWIERRENVIALGPSGT